MAQPHAHPDQRGTALFPMWKGLAASLVAHALAAVVIGAMPRGGPLHHGSSDGVFEELPAVVTLEAPEVPFPDERAEAKPEPEQSEPLKLAEQPPEPPRVVVAKEPEPQRVKLGSPTSASDAATMTWIGFDEFIEHSGTPSEVDQAQFTMDAPGPRGVVPSEGVAASPGMPITPPPAPGSRTEPQVQPPAPAAAAPVARATDEPLLISDVESRPRSTPPQDAPSEAAPAAEAEVPPAKSEAQGKKAPAAPTPRPPETEVGPSQDKVEPTAPAPKALPKEVRGEDKEEIAVTAQGTAPGETTVIPREAVKGAEAPRFPVSDKAIEPSKALSAKEGPNAESVKERRPDTGSDGKGTDGTGKGETPEKTVVVTDDILSPHAPDPELHTDPRQPNGIPVGAESQGPRLDPNRANETPSQTASNDSPSAQSNATPQPPVTPGIPTHPRVGTGQDGRGVLSDRESLAAAIKRAVDVEKWGQPLVAKGLRIRTVRPKFSKYTQITARGSPVIRICFDRAGMAREVIVLSSSGVVDVDRPVVDAAYQWTATGKELEQLRENPPETVAIDVRVIR